jgi:hypothetical protein
MLASEAKSAAIASPRSRMSASWRCIRLVRIPRRRCDGAVATAVTPATAAVRPGTVIGSVSAAAVPTMSVPSNAASVRSNSVTDRSCRSSSAVGYAELNACSITA